MFSTRTTAFAVAALAASAVLTLSACGSSGGGGGGQGANVAQYDSMSMTQLASAAAKEGSVNFYTTFASDELDGLIGAFNKTYPKVKVNALRLSPEDILPRISTEAKAHKYAADLVSGQSAQIGQLQQIGLLSPFTAKNAPALPAGAKLPKGYAGVVYITTTVIAYNKQVVAQKHLPVPTSYEVLTDPRWKGNFSIDPSATAWYDTLVQTMGAAKAKDLVDRLGKNKPIPAASHTLAVTQVQAGEPAATATAYGYRVASLIKGGDKNLALTNTNPLSTAMNLIDPVANAPHPAAARLLESWLESTPGQQAIAKYTGQVVLSPDVPNNPLAWDPTKWKPVFSTAILPSSTYNAEVKTLSTGLQVP